MWTTSHPYTVILIIGSFVTLSLAVYTWTRRRSTTAIPFIGLMLACAFYAFGYALELSSRTLAGMLLWTKVEYVGIACIPVFWLLLATRYTSLERRLSKSVLMVMIGISSLTLIFNWTSAYHHLYYNWLGISTAGPFPLLSSIKGPWYWVHQVYTNIALVAGTIILIGALARSAAPYRRQTSLMVAGAMFPWIAYVIYLFGGSPYGIDLTPFGMVLAAPLFVLGLFRFGLLDLIPVAREAIFAGMSDGVIVVDGLDRIIDFNPAAKHIFPALDRNMTGRHVAEALSKYPSILDLLFAGDAPAAEIAIDDDQVRKYFRVRLSPILGYRKKTLCRALLFNDATEEVLLREKLRAQATTDDLTNAYNRRHFFEQGKREISRAKRSGHALSVIIADLDHFKDINDAWGHEAGDQALQEASRRFKEQLRSADLFGRHGGEEFAILLPETPPDQACLVAERLKNAIDSTPIIQNGASEFKLTASLGVAGVDRIAEETIEDLIRAADRAMYQAKSAGRNCVRCSPSVTSAPF